MMYTNSSPNLGEKKSKKLLVFLIGTVLITSSCKKDIHPEDEYRKNIEINQDFSNYEPTLPNLEFERDYKVFNALAECMAKNQAEYTHKMKLAMNTSLIKEKIVNLSKDVTSGNNNGGNRGEYLSNLANIVKADQSMKSLAETTFSGIIENSEKEINTYFPVKEHRENVLNRGEKFWVIFRTPVDKTNEVFYIEGYNEKGETKIFSSEFAPKENVLVIAYSENQEKYSPKINELFKNSGLMGKAGIDPYNRDRDRDEDGNEDRDRIDHYRDSNSTGGGASNSTPIKRYSGLRVRRVKTKGIHDGWFDGDLELNIRIEQLDGSINTPIGNVSVSAFTFMNIHQDHDAGRWSWSWWKAKYRDSNRWTNINHYRRWSERAHVTVLGVKIYHDTFRIYVDEEDSIFDDSLGSVSFNKSTHLFGSDFVVSGGSQKVWVTLDSGNYPASVY